MSEEKIQVGTRIDDPNAVRDVIPDGGLRPVLARVLGKGRAWFGGDRFGGVYAALQTAVQYLQPRIAKPPALLDFGCGNMAISSLLQESGVVESVRGVDTYAAPSGGDEKFSRYTQIEDAANLPFAALDFDVTICVDVLHHIGISQAPGVLRELGRVSRFVVIKDHFEYGFISRQLLRLADWYGNYAYGVNVPDRYFDPVAWQEIVAAAGMDEIQLTCPVRIHDGFFGWIILPKNHFVSILTAK